MKNLFFLLLLTAGFFTACQSGPEGENAQTSDDTKEASTASAEAVSYKVDTDASVINWEGYKPGQYGHQGTIKLQGGELNVKNGMPESGISSLMLLLLPTQTWKIRKSEPTWKVTSNQVIFSKWKNSLPEHLK